MGRISSTALIALLLCITVMGQVAAPPIGDTAFLRTWEYADRLVADGIAVRSWMWGPVARTEAIEEPYAESPGGRRVVQYFDKSRMEINDPYADSTDKWYVTNGLLAWEMITGNIQVGDDAFEPMPASDTGVAGDPTDMNGPTYSTFSELIGAPANPTGSVITSFVARDGGVITDEGFAGYGVQASLLDENTRHTTADVFQQFIDLQGPVFKSSGVATATIAGVFSVGRPITEAYWARIVVSGTEKDVLVQCFERRCLTFTPDNPEGWKVEAGNVGLH